MTKLDSQTPSQNGTHLYIAGEKAMAPHSSTLAWKIPWTEEPGRLQSVGSRRVGHDWGTDLIWSDIFLSSFKWMKWSESSSVMSDSLQPHELYSPWNSLGHNTGVGSISLLQGIFPTQRLNPGLLHCRQILYQLSHKWSPRNLECVAYPFSSRSSQAGNQTGVSCITGRVFTNWAIKEDCKWIIMCMYKT